MRIIFISPNTILHQHWDKSINQNSKLHYLYSKNELEIFEFFDDDIVLFDYDNMYEYLTMVLKSRVICLSSNLDEFKGYKLLKMGIKAYGNSYMTPFNLKNVINTVNEGKVWIYAELMSFIINNTTIDTENKKDLKIDLLTQRELGVVKELSKGLTNKQIADNLNISERTVKAHISSSYRKLELNDRVSLGILIKEHFN
ncbi:MAG: response regulator transcription factor [Halarcobacter sp.]